MKTLYAYIALSFTLLLLPLTSETFAQPYTINSVFSDTTDYDHITDGIYIIWWDNEFDYEEDALEMLTKMNPYRDYCLSVLEMSDPPNPLDGYYYNVYLHNGMDDFPDGWGNGQGTDSNGYPFLTIPFGAHLDWVNVAHETFHIFQYNATSPGFVYSGDSQWYIEASANWFAALQNPTVDAAFVEAESLIRLPQVPLWLSFDNFPDDYPENWQRYVHQYALALFLYYLSEETDVPDELITNGLYAGTSELPQEYFYNEIGSTPFRNHFIDFASRMTNDFDFLPSNQITRFETEWDDYADPEDDNEFIAIYNDEGTNGWIRPEDENVTRAWSFNSYKINITEADNYLFEINGDLQGSEGSITHFQGKVLLKNDFDETVFIDLEMDNNAQGSLSIPIPSQITEVYLIVASMPEVFTDVSETYSYEVKITRDLELGLSDIDDLKIPELLNRYDILGRDVLESTQGIQFLYYSDGSVKKIFNRGR